VADGYRLAVTSRLLGSKPLSPALLAQENEEQRAPAQVQVLCAPEKVSLKDSS